MMYSDSLIDELVNRVGDTPTEFSNVVFSREETTLAAGALPYQLLTSWCWYPTVNGTYDESRVDPAHCMYAIEKWGTKEGLKVIEIETWHPYKQADIARPNWVTAASLWKEHTDNRMGFYRIVPDISDMYWEPILLKRDLEAGGAGTVQRNVIDAWMHANDANYVAVCPYIDYVCPQCYVQYSGDQEEWRWAIGLQLLEAARIAQGKSLYPIVWHRAQSSKVPLTRDEFVSSLKYVLGFPGVDGIVMYDTGDAASDYKWQDVIADVVRRTGDFAVAVKE